MRLRTQLTLAAAAARICLSLLAFTSVASAGRVLTQADGDTAPAQPSGTGSAAPGEKPPRKVTVSSSEELVERLRQGWQYIELTDHVDVSSTPANSQDVLLFSTRGLYLKVCPLPCKRSITTLRFQPARTRIA
jgi:hypothetical protein